MSTQLTRMGKWAHMRKQAETEMVGTIETTLSIAYKLYAGDNGLSNKTNRF